MNIRLLRMAMFVKVPRQFVNSMNLQIVAPDNHTLIHDQIPE